jgi:hypothetical protein
MIFFNVEVFGNNTGRSEVPLYFILYFLMNINLELQYIIQNHEIETSRSLQPLYADIVFLWFNKHWLHFLNCSQKQYSLEN